MKRLKDISLLFLLFATTQMLFAQTKVVNESFESGTGVFSSSGSDGWVYNDSLWTVDSGSIHCAYSNNSTNTLTLTSSIVLDTFDAAILEFDHIAKTEISEKTVVLISIDGGSKWDTLGSEDYLGAAYLFRDHTFFDGSYSEWDFNNYTTPDNSWWKREKFILDSYLSSQVKIRFVIEADQILNYYGWVIDNVVITGVKGGELDPPDIDHTPISFTGNTGPQNISAIVTDASGLDSVQLYYRVDSGAWNGPNEMTDLGSDTFSFNIPGQAIGSQIDYYIRAIDASSFNNVGINPSGQGSSYHTYQIIQAIANFPYFTDFEIGNTDNWKHKADITVGNTGVVPNDDWDYGTPQKTFFMSAYSGDYVFVTGTNLGYSGNSRSSLLTPIFDVSSVNELSMSFYHKYLFDFGDGARIDYIAGDLGTVNNDLDWRTLGSIGDLRGRNWYDNFPIASASDHGPRPGFGGGAASTWTFSEYDLSEIVESDDFIRFRFVITSQTFSWGSEGWMIDDFSLEERSFWQPWGIENDDSELKIYPNPASNFVVLPLEGISSQNKDLRIIDALGAEVMSINLNQEFGNYTLDVSSLSEGVYSLILATDQDIYKGRLVRIQ